MIEGKCRKGETGRKDTMKISMREFVVEYDRYRYKAGPLID